MLTLTDDITVVSSVKASPMDDPLVTTNTLHFDDIRRSLSLKHKQRLGNPEQTELIYGQKISLSAILGYQPLDVEDPSEYIPLQINITSPSVLTSDEMYPLCYYRNFVVRWNADSFNSNGVIAMVEWNGNMVFGKSYDNVYIRTSDLFPDNGTATLSSGFFEGIPDGAVCTLTLLRAGFDNIRINESDHRIIGETHARLTFILVRQTQSAI